MINSRERTIKIKAIEKALPELKRAFKKCDLCARACNVDRTAGVTGFCGAADEAVVYSYSDHHGEEPPLSGLHGSGTIFFSHCNMGCVYCQNYQFSHRASGKKVSAGKLADMMLDLQARKCHNINFVSPTHFVPVIAEALLMAYQNGLSLPVVYNTGGYDSLRIIRMLEGIVDIYLPDMRYSSDEMAAKYSSAPGYVSNNRSIVTEMKRQAGDLRMTKDGIAEKGLLIRLLVLPNNISGTAETLEYIAAYLGKNTYLSVMSQYYPAYQAKSHKDISRRINEEEYMAILAKIEELGLHEGWAQPFGGRFDDKFAGENFPPGI